MTETPQSEAERESGENEKPPFFASWRSLYAAVLGELVVVILLMYLFTISFR